MDEISILVCFIMGLTQFRRGDQYELGESAMLKPLGLGFLGRRDKKL